jgi:hypothetical protein
VRPSVRRLERQYTKNRRLKDISNIITASAALHYALAEMISSGFLEQHAV